MRIINGRLEGVRFQRAKFYGGTLKNPRGIVVHGTSGALNKFSTVKWLARPWDSQAKRWRKASYHFLIERDGTVTQMVPTTNQAWHAGRSNWNGLVGLNSSFFGIGLVCPGKLDENGKASSGYRVKGFELVHKKTDAHGDGFWLPYSDEQIAAFDVLARALADAYADCNEMIGHHDCSPGRKIDPTPLFPWDHCRSELCKPPTVDPVADVEDDLSSVSEAAVSEKTMTTSKVGGAAVVQGVGAGAVAGATVLEKAADTAEKTSTSTEKLLNAAADPVVLIAFAAVCLACFFFWDRYRKNKDWGI